jgi:hypothetical protein
MDGVGDRLLLVLDDGMLVQYVQPRCGSPWERGGGLAQPRDVVVSPDGWLAVADTVNHRLAWYTHRGSCLELFGEEGRMPGQFQQPAGLALAPDRTLAVADTWNGRVQLLRPGGALSVVGDGLYGPRDLLWAPDGALLVADTGNRLLLRYRPPRWDRQELYAFEGPVVGLEWIGGLLAAAVPITGEVVLLDPQTWSAVRSLQVPAWVDGGQQEGYLLAMPSGELLASAPERHELWLLDPTGTRPAERFRDGLPGVTGLALLPDGSILASQTWEDRLVRLEPDDSAQSN